MMRALAGVMARYRDVLVERLGLSSRGASLEELGPFPRRLTVEERHLECARDLLAGNEVSQRTNKPIRVYFC